MGSGICTGVPEEINLPEKQGIEYLDIYNAIKAVDADAKAVLCNNTVLEIHVDDKNIMSELRYKNFSNRILGRNYTVELENNISILQIIKENISPCYRLPARYIEATIIGEHKLLPWLNLNLTNSLIQKIAKEHNIEIKYKDSQIMVTTSNYMNSPFSVPAFEDFRFKKEIEFGDDFKETIAQAVKDMMFAGRKINLLEKDGPTMLLELADKIKES